MITKLQVKYIQSLGQKKFRDDAAVFVAEGPKIINELLQHRSLSLQMVYATDDWMHQHGRLVQDASLITPVTNSELERISFLQTPHQVLAVFKKPAPVAPDLKQPLSLMLDGIQDPGNMGTILRTADWFGISQVVCSPDCADAYAPKVVQSTMGSIERVSITYTDLLQFIASAPVHLYAATLNGQAIGSVKSLQAGSFLVIGNESKGVSEALLTHCRHRLTIPRSGHAESLNAAVATGIILSQLTALRS